MATKVAIFFVYRERYVCYHEHMNFDITSRTLYRVKHGSHCYGLNTPESDLDIKGFAIPPKNFHMGFLHGFEQYEKMGSKDGSHDEVIYSLKKFAKLAANCNPSIVEILFVEPEDILYIDQFGEEIRDHASEFLSTKTRHTFAGYMASQVKRIKTHRSWLLNPPTSPPSREEFGLSETTKVSKSELGAFEASVKSGLEIELPKDIITLFTKEKRYQHAKTQWDQYQHWKKTRNPKRAELEAKFGYDTKCAYHVIRLGRMACEILEQGKVIVKRTHDREDFFEIRDGHWSYDKLVEEAEKLDERAGKAYETAKLPKEPDRVKLDKLVVDITDRYLTKFG